MLSNEQVQAIVQGLLSNNLRTNEVEEERTRALEYFECVLAEKENLPEGHSEISSGAVQEAVLDMMPGLVRIFTDTENLVEFLPNGPNDVELAQQETDRVSHAFWMDNPGFLNLVTFLQDALVSKTGILKAWWDTSGRPYREEYSNLTPDEVLHLLNEADAIREPIAGEVNENGGVDITFETRPGPQVRIMAVPPEEFGVLDNTESPDVQEARGCWHRTKRMRSDLIVEGFDRDKIMDLDSVGESQSEGRERLARYGSNVETHEAELDKVSQEVWITEYYGYIDVNEDDIAELVCVTIGGRAESAGGVVLSVEEVDHIPFATASPYLRTHQFYGFSLADLIMGPEDIKTSILRGIVDNTNLTVHGRFGANEQVNLDDLMTWRPQGVVRTRGDTPPQNHIVPLPATPLPPQAFEMLNVADEMVKGRTGASAEAGLLDVNSLANVNVGTAAIVRDHARAKSELIARMLGELAFAPLFRLVRELLQKNQDRREVLQIRGQWVEVSPSDWKSRGRLRVHVGTGSSSNEKQLMGIGQVLNRQLAIVQAGATGVLANPQNYHKALVKEAMLLGIPDPMEYYMDPATAQPPEPKPDPQQEALKLQAQLTRETNQVSMAKVQMEGQKIASNARIQEMQVAQRADEAKSRQAIEQMRTQLATLEARGNSNNQQAKADLEMQKQLLNVEIKRQEMALSQRQEAAGLEMDRYRADLSALTTLVTHAQTEASAARSQVASLEEAVSSEAPQADNSEMLSLLEELRAEVADTREQLARSRAKKTVVRDPNTGFITELMSEYGSQRVIYDDQGDLIGIE